MHIIIDMYSGSIPWEVRGRTVGRPAMNYWSLKWCFHNLQSSHPGGQQYYVFLVCEVLLKTKLNKIPIKLVQTRVWYSLAIERYQTVFLRVWSLNEVKINQIILKRKSNVKTESTLGKQQAREIRRGLDSEGIIMLRFRPIKEERIILETSPKMVSTCRFKKFLLGKQIYWHFHREYLF